MPTPEPRSQVTPDPLHMLHLDGRYLFPADPDEVWRNMCRVDEFPAWWRWLRDFEVEGDGLETGGVLRGLVVPPIPYRFRVGIHLDEVQPAVGIRASLSGDLRGPAELDLIPHIDGCVLSIRWDVEMRKHSMRSAARFCRPLLVWGHDQVIEITVRRFRSIVTGHH
jgi:hypothetical protein